MYYIAENERYNSRIIIFVLEKPYLGKATEPSSIALNLMSLQVKSLRYSKNSGSILAGNVWTKYSMSEKWTVYVKHSVQLINNTHK